MTCKDCIHYDVCYFHIDEETSMTVNECAHGFKDKNLFIQLPVPIGTDVYYIDWDYSDDDFVDHRVWFVEKIPFTARMLDGWGIDIFATEKEAAMQIKKERLENDQASIWEENLKGLENGVFGEIATYDESTTNQTMLNYWTAQKCAGYPYASENVEYFKKLLEEKK